MLDRFIGVRVRPDDYQQLVTIAGPGRPVSYIIRLALDDYIKRNKNAAETRQQRKTRSETQ